MRNCFPVLPALLGLAVTGLAQAPKTPADLPALQVAVSQVSESRSNAGRGNGSTTLTFDVSAAGLPPGALVRQVNVTNAVDNLGRTIAASSGSLSSLATSRFIATLSNPYLGGTRGGGGLLPSAALGTVGRDADSIRLVEGTIEFYLPSEANGSVLRIPNILSHVGHLEEPTLAKLGIQLSVFADQASFEELRQATQSGPGGRSSPFMGTGASYSANSVGFVFSDPTGLLVGWQVHNSAGNALPMNGSSRSSSGGASVVQMRLNAPPPPDAQLVLFFTPPESLKTVPFRVENIPLP